MPPKQTPPSRGERATDFVLPLASNNTRTRFYALAGGEPTLLIFTGADLNESATKSLSSLSSRAVPTFVVYGGKGPAPELPFPLFQDEQRAVSNAYRLTDEERPVLFILDVICEGLDPPGKVIRKNKPLGNDDVNMREIHQGELRKEILDEILLFLLRIAIKLLRWLFEIG